jgi:hypothetical protein
VALPVGDIGEILNAPGDAGAASRRYYRPMRQNSSRLVATVVLIVTLAGCAQVRYTPNVEPGTRVEAPPPNAPRFEQAIGQDPATVAELRAAPAPKQPELTDGSSPNADEQSLNGRSYARIGDASVPPGHGDARGWFAQQGVRVGADKVLVYRPDSEGVAHATFYVRYRLPFGATFRSVTAGEKEKLGSGGVQIGEVVAGTPASEANLRAGDFVVKFGDAPVADRSAFEKLLREHLGQRVMFTVMRDGFTFTRLVRLGVTTKRDGDAGKR